MKKIILSLLLASMHAAYASQSFTGFYGNVGIGGTLLDIHENEAISINSITPGFITAVYPSIVDLEGRGAAGEIGLGYSYQFENHFVLAVQATAGLSNPQITHRNGITISTNTISPKLTTELQNDFALLFKPGYVFNNDFQIYALIGPRWGNFSSTSETEVLGTNLKTTQSSYELGITAGVGVLHLITQHISFGLEYAYTDYGRIADLENTSVIGVSLGGPPIPSTFVDQTKVDAKTNTFMAQLNYYF